MDWRSMLRERISKRIKIYRHSERDSKIRLKHTNSMQSTTLRRSRMRDIYFKMKCESNKIWQSKRQITDNFCLHFLVQTSFMKVTLPKLLSYCQQESMHRSLYMDHKGNYSFFVLQSKTKGNWFKSKSTVMFV